MGKSKRSPCTIHLSEYLVFVMPFVKKHGFLDYLVNISYKIKLFPPFLLQIEINALSLHCVFHSIRFKVNKRLEYGGTPFFCA